MSPRDVEPQSATRGRSESGMTMAEDFSVIWTAYEHNAIGLTELGHWLRVHHEQIRTALSETAAPTGEYRVVWDETGGYDCMYGSFDIVRENGDIAAEVDLRHYGQEPCEYEGPDLVDAKERAEAVAYRICNAINAASPARSAIAPGWIQISERRPDGAVEVITFGAVVSTRSARWVCDLYAEAVLTGEGCAISHWMPLPEAPHG